MSAAKLLAENDALHPHVEGVQLRPAILDESPERTRLPRPFASPHAGKHDPVDDSDRRYLGNEFRHAIPSKSPDSVDKDGASFIARTLTPASRAAPVKYDGAATAGAL